jgi:hypothetical protein
VSVSNTFVRSAFGLKYAPHTLNAYTHIPTHTHTYLHTHTHYALTATMLRNILILSGSGGGVLFEKAWVDSVVDAVRLLSFQSTAHSGASSRVRCSAVLPYRVSVYCWS